MKNTLVLSVLATGLLLGGVAVAEHRPEGERAARHVDARYGHNHAYPAPGLRVRAVPREAVVVHFGPGRYWFHGGVWYRARGPGFVVVAPPIGIILPVLPPFYTTLMVGGVPYYYANRTYYAWSDPDQGYRVVDAPPGVEAAQVVSPATAAAGAPPTGAESVFIYPKNGQSAEQQDKDRYECHRWAADQTGFDPTRAPAEVPATQLATQRAGYLRAMNACLEGRGYTVR